MTSPVVSCGVVSTSPSVDEGPPSPCQGRWAFFVAHRQVLTVNRGHYASHPQLVKDKLRQKELSDERQRLFRFLMSRLLEKMSFKE